VAIQVKSNLNGVAALKKLGIDPAWCDSLMSMGITVKLTAKAFSFMKADGSAGIDVPVTLGQLQMLNAGTLAVTEKWKLQKSVSDAIAAFAPAITVTSPLMNMPQGGPVQLKETTSADLVKGIADKLGAHAKNYGASEQTVAGLTKQVQVPPMKSAIDPGSDKGSVTVGHTPATKGWANFPKAKLHTADPVKLRDATQMYQPVYGTSSGSRYFMVAANADMRVAARLDGGTLSVRIEGPNWSKHASSIAECGFTNVDKTKDYASLHLNVGSEPVVARKTLGAILTGLGVELDTPIPDLKVIYG